MTSISLLGNGALKLNSNSTADDDTLQPFLQQPTLLNAEYSPAFGAIMEPPPLRSTTASATVSPPLSAGTGGLTFTNSFSLDGTFSVLTSAEQAALQADLLAAEANFSALFTNSANIKFDLEAVNVPLVDGSGFIASNSASAYQEVSLTQYFAALQSVDTTTYQADSLAAVEKLNLSAASNIVLPIAYADMLGLGATGQAITESTISVGSTTYNLSSSVNDTLFMNLAVIQQALDAQTANTTNEAVVGTIEHEMSEMSMGRIALMDASNTSANFWTPMDFYRVTSTGASDLTPNDGSAIFFSPDPGVTGPESALQFNNSSSGGDYADWTSTTTSDPNLTDPFGAGDYNGAVGSESSTLSPTDIDIMNVLGWNVASSSGGGGTPTLTIALADDTGVSPTDGLTDNASLTGTAGANATLTFTGGSGVLGTTTATSSGSWSFTPSLADGLNAVTVSESYGSGQVVTASVSFTLATKAPTVSATESVTGQTSLTSDTITVTAAAENVGANAIAGVEIFDGGADLGAATHSNGVWTFTASNLRTGAHTFTAEATDSAGNVGSAGLATLTVTGSLTGNNYTLSDFSFTGYGGVTDIRPKGVNDSGEVVGYYLDGRADQLNSDDAMTYEHGFVSTVSNGTRSYYTEDDPASSTGTPLVQTRVMGVNDKDELVGWYAQQGDTIGSNGETYRLPAAGFILSGNWPDGGGSLAYASSGDYGTHTLGINNDEDIVGFYYDGAGEMHGLLREFTGYGVRGDYFSLDPAGSINTVAEGINDSGEIVGYYETSNEVYHGFSYNNATGVYTTLDVNGASDTYALGVNDSGEVVGFYVDSAGDSHGFVETAGGQLTTIDDANASAEGTEVTGIANDGEIVGWYFDSSGHTHGFTGISAAPVVAIASATGQTTVSLNGTIDAADVGEQILIYDGSTQIGSASASSNGAWSASVSVTSTGIHILTAQAVNASGDGVSNPVIDLVSGASDTLNNGGQNVIFDGSNNSVTLTGHGNTVYGAGGAIKLASAAAAINAVTVGGNGAAGASFTISGSNASITLDAQSRMDVTGSTDNITAGAGDNFGVTGASDTVTGTSGDGVWIGGNGAYGLSDIVNVSGATVNVSASSRMDLTGSTDKITAGASDNFGVTGASDTVTGASGDGIWIGGNGAYGSSDIVNVSGATVNLSAGSRMDLIGSTDEITAGASDNFGVTGASDTVAGSSGDGIWIGGNGAYGSSDIVNVSGATANLSASSRMDLTGSTDNITAGASDNFGVTGASDTVTGASGDGIWIGGNGAYGSSDIVNVSGATVNLSASSRMDLTGSTDKITAGTNSNFGVTGASDTVTGTSGDGIWIGGNGAYGSSDIVNVSDATVNLSASSRMDLTGSTDKITAGASDNFGVMGGGNTITAGATDSVYVNAGSGDIVIAGANDSVVDHGAGTHVNVLGAVGALDIYNFGSDSAGIVDLLNGVGGYGSASNAYASLTSDGSSGSQLSLGNSGTIDFVGIAPSSLSANNFKIG